MSDLGRAAFDHTAFLQQRVDELAARLDLLALAGLALALALFTLTIRIWLDR